MSKAGLFGGGMMLINFKLERDKAFEVYQGTKYWYENGRLIREE